MGKGRAGVGAEGGGFGMGGALAVAASLLWFGRPEWTQMVSDRMGAATHSAGLGPTSNIRQVLDFAGTDVGLFSLAAAGAILVLVANWRLGLILDVWALATLVVLVN